MSRRYVLTRALVRGCLGVVFAAVLPGVLLLASWWAGPS